MNHSILSRSGKGKRVAARAAPQSQETYQGMTLRQISAENRKCKHSLLISESAA